MCDDVNQLINELELQSDCVIVAGCTTGLGSRDDAGAATGRLQEAALAWARIYTDNSAGFLLLVMHCNLLRY